MGVVGAGPAGLTTALALYRHAPPGAVEVTMVDRHASTAEYPGVEYGLQNRAMRALHRIGADEVPRWRGHPVSRIEFHDERRDRRALALRVNPRWTVGVLRREFLADLASAVPAPILRGRTVVDLALPTDDAVRVRFAESADPLDVDLLVAADGAGSAVRRLCFPEQAVTHDRGFSVVYVLADGQGRPAHTLPGGFLDAANGGTIRLSRGFRVTTAWFPAGHGRLTLALGFDHPTREELWAEQGLAAGTSWAEVPGPLRRQLAGRIAADISRRDGLLGAALDLVRDWEGPDTYLWPMRDSDPLPRPYSATHPVVLLGDAAHAFLPTLGMGASLAIEDAEALGALVGRHLRTPSGSLREDVLVPFGRTRFPVWRDLMNRSRAAVVNWRHHELDQGFVLFPYVPTRVGSTLVRTYERLRGKVTD